MSGTIAIKQCACNRFLLTIESAMWQRKKYGKSVGLASYSIMYINCWTMHILPNPVPLLIGEARGLASDYETLCLGVLYRTQRLPGTRPIDTEYYLFILFIFCVKLHYSRCSPANIHPNRPAKKRTHNSLITKIPFFMPFFQLCKDLPQRVRATSKARIYQNYIFDRRK